MIGGRIGQAFAIAEVEVELRRTTSPTTTEPTLGRPEPSALRSTLKSLTTRNYSLTLYSAATDA